MKIKISGRLLEEEVVCKWLADRGLVAIEYDVANKLAHDDMVRGDKTVIFDAESLTYRKHPQAYRR